MKRLLPLFILLAVSPVALSTQHLWEAGAFLGGSTYQGDLTPSALGALREVNPAYGLLVRRYLSPRFSLRANLLHTRLSGEDSNFPELSGRGFSFSNDITEASLTAEWRLFSPRAAGSRLTPYLFAGAGLIAMTPKVNFDSQGSTPPPAGTKEDAQADYALNRLLLLPLGFGLHFSLNSHWAVSAEGGFRSALTDYLDGVSLAGNPERKDWYAVGGVSLVYSWQPRDKDHDGIADTEDQCPGLAGIAIHDGCPDNDGDGFADRNDDCPALPGPLRGCPDSDGDGVADIRDSCPNQAGPPSRAGCPPKDTDGDGILDEEDRCPNQIGPASRQGCPLLDTDHDGIEDSRDQCPEEAGSRLNFGCPEPIGEANANYRLFFSTNSAELLARHQLLLSTLARAMNRKPGAFLLINGHADDAGEAAANQALSLQRARACYNFLIGQGVPPQRMRFEGYGENAPAAPNTTEAGRSQNRRVELELQLQ